MKRILCLLASFLCMSFITHAQVQQPYILNGDATQKSCNCYQLTPANQFASGTVWNKNKIDLTQSFNYVFDINLGCDPDGADGIAFILQTQGTNLGASGQGIGFKGISPSLGVIIDTHQNFDEADPSYDHLAVQMNGITNHSSPVGNLVQPVQVIDGVTNIKDCAWHLLRINWDATTMMLEISVDNDVRATTYIDMVNDIFGGNPSVYWGFAGATGGQTNVQQFCAALRPAFSFDAAQQLCEGTPVQFNNTSSSFGSVTNWYWDLGDGTTFNGPVPPLHLYPGAGVFPVKFVIQDNSGCISDTLKTSVTIGSYPIVDFTPATVCLGTPMTLTDKSKVAYGTLNYWQWDWGDGTTSEGQTVVSPYNAVGSYGVTLTVSSKEGCATSGGKYLRVAPSPAVAATSANVCLGSPSQYFGTNLTPAIDIASWTWDFGNQDHGDGQNTSYQYPVAGNYAVQLHALSDEGCAAESPVIPVAVISVKADAGTDTLIAAGQPLQLFSHATNVASAQYQWTPAVGLNNPYIANPVAMIPNDLTYTLKVTSPEGCTDEASIFIKVFQGPEFYVPTGFSPNNDGHNDYFKVIAAGVPTIDFFRVWNRWGELVFTSNDLHAQWDGTVNGKPADAATYVWMIQGVDYTGRRFSRQGTVTLVR